MRLFKKKHVKEIEDEQLVAEKAKQTDAVKIQEFHRSGERIAEMIKAADENETW